MAGLATKTALFPGAGGGHMLAVQGEGGGIKKNTALSNWIQSL